MKVALVGSGRIAQRHAAVLASGSVNGVKLAGVCDTTVSKAQALGLKYAAPAFVDADQMIEEVEPDVISILTESGNHSKNVRDLVWHRKHFVVEKPLALTVSDAQAMVTACEDANVKVFVVKQNRFNKATVALKSVLDTGSLGDPFLATARVRWTRRQDYYDLAPWRGTVALDGGVLANQASHHLDMLLWLMGPVSSVVADQSRVLANIESHDLALGILKFENGARGLIEATTATRPSDLEGSVSVLGSRGSVVVGGFSMNRIDTWNVPGVENPAESAAETPPDVYGYGHSEFYRSVRDSLSGHPTESVGAQAGLRVVELLEALEISAKSGKEVVLRDDRRVTR